MPGVQQSWPIWTVKWHSLTKFHSCGDINCPLSLTSPPSAEGLSNFTDLSPECWALFTWGTKKLSSYLAQILLKCKEIRNVSNMEWYSGKMPSWSTFGAINYWHWYFTALEIWQNVFWGNFPLTVLVTIYIKWNSFRWLLFKKLRFKDFISLYGHVADHLD